MGNIFEKISKTQALVGLSAVSARQKRLFRNKLISSIPANKSQFVNQLNQVYLKDHVEHFSIRNNAQFPIYKVAITGGPCAGKSTSLERIRKQFNQRGYRVLSVPEIPTMVVVAGGMILMSQFNIQERVKFQSLLMRFQMYAEDYFTKLAQMSKSPSIVLCDRGVVDPYAYISSEQWQAIMDEEGWSWVTLRDRRYDRVVFLSSAANGAEQFYSLENNVARSQGIEVARALDKKTLQGWIGHPHLTVIPNTPGETFEQKINHAVVAVQKTVGFEIDKLSYEKYLIAKPEFPKNIKIQISDIEETFLVNRDERFDEDKLKKRGQSNSYTYQRKYRTKKDDLGEYSQEIRKPLTSLQHVILKEQQSDPNFRTIERKRINFVYNNISYAIDQYYNILGQDEVHLLRFSSDSDNKLSQVPQFIKVIKDAKRDKRYSLKQIARIQK